VKILKLANLGESAYVDVQEIPQVLVKGIPVAQWLRNTQVVDITERWWSGQ